MPQMRTTTAARKPQAGSAQQARTKVCLFLPPDAAHALKVIAAQQGCKGVSDVVEQWIRRAGVPATTGLHPALCLCNECVPAGQVVSGAGV